VVEPVAVDGAARDLFGAEARVDVPADVVVKR